MMITRRLIFILLCALLCLLTGCNNKDSDIESYLFNDGIFEMNSEELSEYHKDNAAISPDEYRLDKDICVSYAFDENGILEKAICSIDTTALSIDEKNNLYFDYEAMLSKKYGENTNVSLGCRWDAENLQVYLSPKISNNKTFLEIMKYR